MRVLFLCLLGASAFADKSDLSVPDRKFIETVASDNLAEIQLGKLALDKSQNAQVRNFAQQMIDDHKKSEHKLQSVAWDEKFPLPTSPTTEAQKEYQRLAKLDGERFDREYLKLMDKRHREVIDTFEKAKLQNPELKKWADETLPALKEHKELGETQK